MKYNEVTENRPGRIDGLLLDRRRIAEPES